MVNHVFMVPLNETPCVWKALSLCRLMFFEITGRVEEVPTSEAQISLAKALTRSHMCF